MKKYIMQPRERMWHWQEHIVGWSVTMHQILPLGCGGRRYVEAVWAKSNGMIWPITLKIDFQMGKEDNEDSSSVEAETEGFNQDRCFRACSMCFYKHAMMMEIKTWDTPNFRDSSSHIYGHLVAQSWPTSWNGHETIGSIGQIEQKITRYAAVS